MAMSGAVGGAGGMGSEPVSSSTSRGDSMGQEAVLEGTAGRGVTVRSQSATGVEGGFTGDQGEGVAGGMGAVGAMGGLGVAGEGSARSSGSLKALGVAPAVWQGLSAGATVPLRAGSSSNSSGRGPLAAGTGVTDVTDVTAIGGSGGLISEGSELQAGTAGSAESGMQLDAADTQAAASAAQGVSGAGQGVYNGGPHLAAGLESVPLGTSFEEAAREANALTDTVVAERKSEMASQGEQKSEKSEISESSENFTVQLELPAKAFDSLSRPAGLVQGAPVSPHAHAAQQPGMGGAANTWSGSSHGVLQGVGANTVPTSLSTASHTGINAPAGIRGSTGVATGGADVSDVAPLRDSSSSSSTGGGMDALEAHPAAPKHPEPEADKPLGRRSYAEALAANLTAPDTPTVTPTPTTTTTTTGGTTTTTTATEPAALDTPRSKQGVGPAAVSPAAAPAGAAVPAAAAAAEQSPRKRSFFGSLKKALGSSSSRNEA